MLVFFFQSHFWNDSKGKLLQAFSPPGSPTLSGRNTPESTSSSDESLRYTNNFNLKKN